MSTANAQSVKAQGRSASRLIGIALLLIAAVANCGFVLASAAGSTLSPFSSFVSELGADGQPGAWIFHTADALQGVCLLLASAFLWHEFPNRKIVRIGQICLVVIGVLTAADAFLALDCVPTLDAACRMREELGQVSFEHESHSVTGILEGLAINAVMLTFGVASHRQSSWRALGVVGYSFGLIYTGLNVFIAAQYLEFLPDLGITQRVQVVMFSAFLVVLAVTLIELKPGQLLGREQP